MKGAAKREMEHKAVETRERFSTDSSRRTRQEESSTHKQEEDYIKVPWLLFQFLLWQHRFMLMPRLLVSVLYIYTVLLT